MAWFDVTVVNQVHHHLWERHVVHWCRALTQTWRVWRAHGSGMLERWRWVPRRKGSCRIEGLNRTRAPPLAASVLATGGRAILSGLDPKASAAVIEAVREDHAGDRQAREQALAARAEAVDLLLSLVQQLLGVRWPSLPNLYSKGISSLDVFRTNRVLAAYGIRVRCAAVPGSVRQVTTTLAPDRTEPRAIFWVEAVPKDERPEEPMRPDGIPLRYVVRS